MEIPRIYRRYYRKAQSFWTNKTIENGKAVVHKDALFRRYQNVPRGLIVSCFDVENPKRVNFGFALAHRNDFFVKQRAFDIAVGRMQVGVEGSRPTSLGANNANYRFAYTIQDITSDDCVNVASNDIPDTLLEAFFDMVHDMRIKYNNVHNKQTVN